MRRILISLALALTVLCSPVRADILAQGQCALDAPASVGGTNFTQCPVLDTNDGLITAGFPGARLDASNKLSHTPIFVHNVCKYVDALNMTDATFIPYNTEAEWLAFLQNKPQGVRTAECCLPRPINRSDVQDPTETCSTGWKFIGLVDPNDSAKLLATAGAGGDFVLVSGVSEDANYPITKMPIERGDIGALIPGQAATAYVGKFHCDGVVDFGTSESPVGISTTSTSQSSSNSWNKVINLQNGKVISSTSSSSTNASATTGTQSGGTAKNVDKLMGFNMQCVNDHWTHTSPSCFGKTTGTETEACPNGQDGLIIRSVIQECDGTIKKEIVSNTCAKTCPARTITEETRACPEGQTGSITVEVAKLCSSTQPVDSSTQVQGCFCQTSETIKTNTCTNTCEPSTKTTITQACPAGQDGIITIERTRSCHASCQCGGSQCVCTDTDKVISNTCTNTCTPSTHTTSEQCPNGQSGQITRTTTHTCPDDQDHVTVDNQCHNTCTPTTNTTSCACPDGQTGQILTTVRHTCPDNQDHTTVDNQCHNTCVPSTHTTPGQCPAGYSGSFSTTVTHICPDNRDVTTTNNNCYAPPPPPHNDITIIPIIIPWDFDFGWDDFGGDDWGDFEDCDCSVDDFDPGFEGGDY